MLKDGPNAEWNFSDYDIPKLQVGQSRSGVRVVNQIGRLKVYEYQKEDWDSKGRPTLVTKRATFLPEDILTFE